MSKKQSPGDLFCDYYAEWVKVYKEGAIRPITLSKYNMAHSWLKKLAPNLKLCDLDRIHYQEIINAYAETHERQTTMDFHHLIKGAILDAVDEGLIKMARSKKNAEETIATETVQENLPPVEATEAPEEATPPEEVVVLAQEEKATEPVETGDVSSPELDAPAEDNGEIKLTLSLPVAMFEQSPGSMQRLKAAIGSKQTLLKKALGTDSLDVVIEEDRVTFPWFTLTSENNAEEVDAYSKLVFALAKKAITQTRVDPIEKIPEDLQLGMRLYLINLQFKGDEFKTARAVLMRNFKSAGGSPVGSTKFELTMPEVYKP